VGDMVRIRMMVLVGGVTYNLLCVTCRHKSVAPAGGAAAAAPERGALAGQSAPTSTSTRWALVTM
jgi:hypothetical protein